MNPQLQRVSLWVLAVGIVAMIVFWVGGCGNTPENVMAAQSPGQSTPVSILEGPPGPPGPQGPPGDSDLLSWGLFNGSFGGSVLESGGPVPITSFTRSSAGSYVITYGVRTIEVAPVAAIATGLGFELDDGENVVVTLGVIPELQSELLTFRVVAVTSLLDSDRLFSLADSDTIFSLVIYGR